MEYRPPAPKDRREPLITADVTLYDSYKKEKYRAKGVMLVGNDKRLIWDNDYFRNRIIKEVFKTPAKVKRAKSNLSLTLSELDNVVVRSYSHVVWGCTKFSS